MDRFTTRFFIITGILLCGPALRAQNVVAIGVCAEYYTDPVVGNIGYNASHIGLGDRTGSKGFISHFAYFSTEAAAVTIDKGLVFGNFFSPGVQTVPNSDNGVYFHGEQPEVFYPGLSRTFRSESQYVARNWFLSSATSGTNPIGKITVTPIGMTDDNKQLLVPSPTCPPEWVPSTSLSYSQPGTYTHQFLGQIDSGPAAAAGVIAVMGLSGNRNVQVSNLTYVPNDTANPSGTFNPNSIYGDITVGYGPAGPFAAYLQLVLNGKVVMKGLAPMTYTGPGPASNVEVVSGTPQSAGLGTQFATPLQVKVTDSNGAAVPGWTVIFSAPSSNASATLSQPAVTDSNGLTSVTAQANSIPGSYSVSASPAGDSATATFTLTNTVTTSTAVNSVFGLAGGSVTLSAAVTSKSVTIDSGTVSFTVANASNVPIAAGMNGSVANGTANATFIVPAGTAPAIYNLTATYSATPPSGLTVYLTSNGSGTLTVLAPGTPIRVTQMAIAKGSGGSYVVTLTLANPTNAAVSGVALTKAQLGSVLSSATVPGTFAANSAATVQVTFPSTVGTSGASVVLNIAGSYNGGSFSAGTRLTLP